MEAEWATTVLRRETPRCQKFTGMEECEAGEGDRAHQPTLRL